MNTFRKGDKVVARESVMISTTGFMQHSADARPTGFIYRNKVYEVVDSYQGYVRISDDGGRNRWTESCFKLLDVEE